MINCFIPLFDTGKLLVVPLDKFLTFHKLVNVKCMLLSLNWRLSDTSDTVFTDTMRHSLPMLSSVLVLTRPTPILFSCAHTFSTYIDKLVKLNRKIFRIVLIQSRYCSVNELCVSFNTLPILNWQLLILVHNTLCHSNTLLGVFANYFI